MEDMTDKFVVMAASETLRSCVEKSQAQNFYVRILHRIVNK